MKKDKKDYNSPNLLVHGTLIEITKESQGKKGVGPDGINNKKS